MHRFNMIIFFFSRRVNRSFGKRAQKTIVFFREVKPQKKREIERERERKERERKRVRATPAGKKKPGKRERERSRVPSMQPAAI